jgi:hypothetical protein
MGMGRRLAGGEMYILAKKGCGETRPRYLERHFAIDEQEQ